MNIIDSKMIESMKLNFEKKTINVTEDGIFSIVGDKLLKEIPILKYLCIGKNLINIIKEYFFVKKIVDFLNEISTISVEERKIFFEKMQKDQESFGENVLLIIDRIDSIEKSLIIAKLFKALVEDEIEIDLFYRFCNVVEKVYIEDIKFLVSNINDNDFTGICGMNLANNALAIRYTYDGRTWGGTDEIDDDEDVRYRVTRLGKKLASILG